MDSEKTTSDSLERAYRHADHPARESPQHQGQLREQQREMVRRFVNDHQQRLQQVQEQARQDRQALDAQIDHTRRWRWRAWRGLLWSLLALGGGTWLLLQNHAIQQPHSSGATALHAEHAEGQVHQASHDDLQTLRAALAEQHWLSANRALKQHDQLLASHHFVRAALHETDPGRADNARLAAREMLGGISLLQVQDLGQRVDEAHLLESGQLLIRGAGQLRLWHPDGSGPLGAALEHGAELLGMVVDYPRVLAWSDRQIQVWDVQQQLSLLSLTPSNSLHGATILGDGYLSWDTHGELCWWGNKGQFQECRQHPGAILGVNVEASLERLLSWSWSPQQDKNQSLLVMHPLIGGEPLLSLVVPGRLTGAALSPDGGYLLGWGSDGRLRLWDSASGELLRLLETQLDWIHGGDFIDDRLLTWSEDGSARLWHPDPQGPLGRGLQHPTAVLGALSSPELRQLLTWSIDGQARLWDLHTGVALSAPLIHQDVLNGARFGPGGMLLTWSEDAKVRLWDSSDGHPLAPELRHPAAVVAAGFIGRDQLFSIDREGGFRRWSRQSRLASAEGQDEAAEVLPTLADANGQLSLGAAMPSLPVPIPHEPWMRGARLSGEARRVLIWGGDLLGGRAEVWDLHNGQLVSGEIHHRDRVAGGVFHPDGQRFLTWTDDSSLQIWSPTGHPLGEPLEPRQRILGARWSPTGERILSWHSDTTVRLWESQGWVELMPAQRVGGEIQQAFFATAERLIIQPLDGPAVGLTLRAVPVLPSALSSAWLEVSSGTGLSKQQQLRVLDSSDWAARHQALPMSPAQLAGVDPSLNISSSRK